MISNIKLLMMENNDENFVFENLTENDKNCLFMWCKKAGVSLPLKSMLSLFMWCENEGDLAEDFEKEEKSKDFNIDVSTLEKLISTHFEYVNSVSKAFDKNRGRFIVFEGLDGSGKGTQISMLSEFLEKTKNVFKTAEPTDSVVGKLIRSVLAGNEKKTTDELATLFLADRVYHNSNDCNGIKKYLDLGYDVVCDRYYYSSFAYQGAYTDLEWVMRSNLDCPEILKPDLCIFLDVDPDVCMRRIEKGRDSIEIFENPEALKKIRAKFTEVFKRLNADENIVVINAGRGIESIFRDIKVCVSML